MSRLSSLRGPSAPSSPSSSGRSAPLTAAQQASAFPTSSLLSSSAGATPHSPPAKTPLQPASIDPSPQHRKCRAVLVEVERTLRDWEAVVRLDGGKAGKALVDSRTELECALNLERRAPESILSDVYPPLPCSNMAIAQRAHTYPHAPSQLPSEWLARLAQAADDMRAALAKLVSRVGDHGPLAGRALTLASHGFSYAPGQTSDEAFDARRRGRGARSRERPLAWRRVYRANSPLDDVVARALQCVPRLFPVIRLHKRD
jgi:hypothetical protein